MKTISEVASEHGRRLAGDPVVCAVGFGAKLRAGVPVAASSLVFFVREKLESAAVAERGSWPVPPSVDGYTTDVVELGHLAVASADRAPPAGNRGKRIDDPLIGGAATMALGTAAPGPGGYGTLGGHCFDNTTRAPLVLSNAHVWGTTSGSEVVQPIMPTTLFGAAVSPAEIGAPAGMVLTRIPPGLAAPITFANSIAQTYLVTGSEADPLPAGQAATPVPAATRTDSEQVTVNAPAAGFPPAGQRLSPTVSWNYRRLSSTSVLQSSSNAPRPSTRLLTARRLFTNAPAYSGSQPVNLYAEIIPAPGGAAVTASSHFTLVLLYPLAAGDKFIPRLLRPTSRQTVTTVTTSFLGFPAPARAGTAVLPAVAGPFAVDAAATGTFVTSGALPAGTFVLRLPTGSVRLFVPPSTQVIIDIDLTGAPGPFQTQSINSARDPVATTVTTAPGTPSRTLVTISGSEIVEVVITGAANGQLFGVTSKRGSPETTAPLCYAGTVSAADLTPKGKWGAGLFVQDMASGLPESANIVETAIGAASFIADCSFDVS